MNEIQEWFKTKDYDAGVEIYARASTMKSRTLATLKRGKSSRNLTILIKELRLLKNNQQAKVSTARPEIFKKPKEAVAPKPTVKENVQLKRNELSRKSTESFFAKVRFGDLPAQLRQRYRILKDLFYEMNECKFKLNDIPAENEHQALDLILKIEDLNDKKSLIWREIDHWIHYKTLLPIETEEDFSKVPPHLLAVKKANIKSSISKISKRIDEWKKSLETIEDKKEKIKTEQQINRSDQKLHKHELNLLKIQNLLHE